MADPHAHAMSLLTRDVYEAADGSGQVKSLVRALEGLGYGVKLMPNSTRVKVAAQDAGSLIARAKTSGSLIARLKTDPPRDK
jgi:hypothetical protein